MTEIRALTFHERQAFSLARLVSGELMPYFLYALFSVQPLAAPGLGTFAVDGRWRLYMDPDLLIGDRAWTPRIAGAVLLHEVGHLLREHAARGAVVEPQPLSPTGWNIATDAEINDDLLEAGVPLPDGVVTPQSIGCEPGELGEDYYAAILAPEHSANPMVRYGDEHDSPGCGSGAGLPVQVWESAPIADAGGLDEASADLVRRQVARTVTEAAAAGRGTVPGGLVRWAGKVLAPPQVPWNQVLRSVLRRAVAHKPGGARPTYTRPSRRRTPGIVLPGYLEPAVRVSVVVDTSGSMSSGDLTAAVGEVAGVLRAQGVDRNNVRVMACDAASSEPTLLRSVEDIELVGGGGTDMRVGIAAAESVHPAPHVIVVLTDGWTPWPDEPTRARLVCVIIGNPHADPPPWAHTVHVPTGAADLAGARS